MSNASRFGALLTASAMLVHGSEVAFQNTEHSTQQRSTSVSMSLREFKHLRNRARTAEDFKILAKWCQQRVDLCRKKQIDCETELKAYYGRPLAVAAPKYPRRDQTLKTLIAHYRELSEHWSERANLYADKAIELEAAAAHK